MARATWPGKASSNLKWAAAPGNVLRDARATGLSRESVANVSRIITLDKALLTERVGKVPRNKLELIHSGIDVVLARDHCRRRHILISATTAARPDARRMRYSQTTF
jgi:hypothetical protein